MLCKVPDVNKIKVKPYISLRVSRYSEALRLRPVLDKRRISSILHCFFHPDGERIQSLVDPVDPAQIHARKRQVRIICSGSLIRIITLKRSDYSLRDPASLCLALRGRLARLCFALQHLQERIVPPVPGLHFFRTYIIVRIILPDRHALQASHQASIKAYEIQLLPALSAMKRGGIHRCLHLVQKQRVRIVELIASVAPERSSAVVPQNERIVISRIILPAEVQKRRQRLRIPHVGISLCLSDNSVRPRARHIQHAIVIAGHTADPPAAPAREDHHIETVKIECGRINFFYIIRSTSQLAL